MAAPAKPPINAPSLLCVLPIRAPVAAPIAVPHVDFAVCVWPVYGLTVVQAETNAKTAKIEIVFFNFSSKKLNLFQKISVQYLSTQFEIVGMAEDNGKGQSGKANWDGLNPHCVINGENKYKRIFILKII